MICLRCQRVFPSGLTTCPLDGSPLVHKETKIRPAAAATSRGALEEETLRTNIDSQFDRSGEHSALRDADLTTSLHPPDGLTAGWLEATAGEQSGPTQTDKMEALPEEESARDSGQHDRRSLRQSSPWDNEAKTQLHQTGPAAVHRENRRQGHDAEAREKVQPCPFSSIAIEDDPTPSPIQNVFPATSTPPLVERSVGPVGAELIGQELHGTYQPIRLIAKGSMSSVFEARHLRLPKKRLALKMLNPTLENLPEAYARFRREAEIATELGNAHIVEVLDFNITDDGHLYLVMEYLEGEDLAEKIQREAPLPLQAVAQIVEQVADGLQATHDQGIVHRDMKPGNIYLLAGAEIRVKILDFGISKLTHTESMVTHYNMIVGTPYFMSPEQARVSHEVVDHTTDIFALAGICYQMLTGTLPFYAPTLRGILDQINSSSPRPLRELNPAVPQGVQRVLDRALAKNKHQRYQRVERFAKEFCQALHAASANSRQRPPTPNNQAQAASPPARKTAIGRQAPPAKQTKRRAVGPTQPILLSDQNVEGLLTPTEPLSFESLRKQPLAYVKTAPLAMRPPALIEDGPERQPVDGLQSAAGRKDILAPAGDQTSIAHQPTLESFADLSALDRSEAADFATTNKLPLIPDGRPGLPYAATRPFLTLSADARHTPEQTLSVPAPAHPRHSKALVVLVLLLVLVGLSLLFLVFQRLRGNSAPRGERISAPACLALVRDPLGPGRSQATRPLSPLKRAIERSGEWPRLTAREAHCSALPGSPRDRPARARWTA